MLGWKVGEQSKINLWRIGSLLIQGGLRIFILFVKIVK